MLLWKVLVDKKGIGLQWENGRPTYKKEVAQGGFESVTLHSTKA